MNQSNEFIIKALLVGQENVGKSSILQRLTHPLEPFNENIKHTVGMEFGTYTIITHNQKEIYSFEDINKNTHPPTTNKYKLQVWDCAGNTKFYSVIKSYFRGSQIIFYVFDITDKKSLESLEGWHQEVLNQVDDQYINVLIGNKIDENKIEVTKEEAEIFANKIDAIYFETSAKTGNGVTKAFKGAVDKLDDLYRQNIFSLSKQKKSNPIVVSKMDTDEEEHGCGKCF